MIIAMKYLVIFVLLSITFGFRVADGKKRKYFQFNIILQKQKKTSPFSLYFNATKVRVFTYVYW